MLNKETAAKAWRERFINRAPRAAAAAIGLTVKAAKGDSTEVLLYDEIGPWGVSAKDFKAALDAVKTKAIVLRINSPGGDVFDGYAMYKAVKDHPATVSVIIDGLAASAASFVAMGGDTVTMKEPALMMIHRAWTLAIGNAEDMTETANLLGKVDGQIADVYAAKSGKPAAEMLALMSAETWLDGKEAGDLGLVDAVDAEDDDAEKARAAAEGSAHAARARATAALIRRAA